MPTLRQAARDLAEKTMDLNDLAKQYADARERQEKAHARSVAADDKVKKAKRPTDKMLEALAKARSDERNAKAIADQLQDKVRTAAIAVMAALAEVVNALLLAAKP
ncbi:MAG TPA: hypothetical protein VF601_12615 [Beijerinckiaceae bacterium]|jgi:predicted nucleotidyltransferase